ncbi:MAG: hypothetical protein IJ570_02110 [Prevotella sp.]|nr:hypothetical protein [Prevotella sp.]
MAASQLDLSVQIFNPVPTSPEHGKSPVKKPIIWQDDYELSFMSSHSDYTLVLCLDGEVVYSVEVPAEATSIVLPSWLEGSYEIQLQTDSNYYFYGYINL